MNKRIFAFTLLAVLLLLSGCQVRTVDQMYCLPRRPESYNDLQLVIEDAMAKMEFSAPRTGQYRQTVQMEDLDGDGIGEYLVFARSNSDKTLQILLFSQREGKYLLTDRVLCSGSSFDRVVYAQLDDQPGMELLVGCQLDGLVPKSAYVFNYKEGKLQQHLVTNYAELLTCDLDADGCGELMVLSAGTAESNTGVVTLYRMVEGKMERSNESAMSGPVENLKRILTGNLLNGVPAVFVGSTVEESAIITDIYALRNGVLMNVSASSESGTSVRTLRNYYVYAGDMDEDGEVELPALIPMKTVSQSAIASEQHLIRWYSLGTDGESVDKLFTYHNYAQGWYMCLDPGWTHRISVEQDENGYNFYLWDENYTTAEIIFSVYILNGQNREEAAQLDNRFVLCRTEMTIYAARMEVASGSLEITQDDLINSFHLIRQAWNTGET